MKMKTPIIAIFLMTSTTLVAGDLDDGIALDGAGSSTNDNLKINKNYQFVKSKAKARVERARYSGTLIKNDDCGSGNMRFNNARFGANSVIVNESNNKGAVSSCDKK